LVTRAEVEVLMGPLRADPQPSEDKRACEKALELLRAAARRL
jgi:hypothetical protein